MREGWHKDRYLILFDPEDIAAVSDRYQISHVLPGFEIVGLCDWDDFLIRDKTGHTFFVPTVVPQLAHISPFTLPDDRTALTADLRLAGKIRWRITPILFGGSPDSRENQTWVSHGQHGQLVRWWCEKYLDLTARNRVLDPR